jgi:hypothetical protein
LFEQQYSFYQSSTNSYFFGFSDQLGQIAVQLNEEPVIRTGHLSVVGHTMPFEPIGPTGIVLYPQGAIACEVIVDLGDDEKPRLPTQSDGVGNDNLSSSNDPHIRYSSPVSLRFVLPDIGKIVIERLMIGASYFESVPNFFLYNHETGKWDRQRTLSVSLTGEQCFPYFDKEGVLYIRYTPTESTGRYDTMQRPWISLKGRVK